MKLLSKKKKEKRIIMKLPSSPSYQPGKKLLVVVTIAHLSGKIICHFHTKL